MIRWLRRFLRPTSLRETRWPSGEPRPLLHFPRTPSWRQELRRMETRYQAELRRRRPGTGDAA